MENRKAEPILVNPNASDNAKRLMKYMCDIYGTDILSGQYFAGGGTVVICFKAVHFCLSNAHFNHCWRRDGLWKFCFACCGDKCHRCSGNLAYN